jgi:hypothetical protein
MGAKDEHGEPAEPIEPAPLTPMFRARLVLDNDPNRVVVFACPPDIQPHELLGVIGYLTGGEMNRQIQASRPGPAIFAPDGQTRIS